MTSITIDKQEYESLLETNTRYKELLDTYDAINIAEQEKKSGRIKKLESLMDLV